MEEELNSLVYLGRPLTPHDSPQLLLLRIATPLKLVNEG